MDKPTPHMLDAALTTILLFAVLLGAPLWAVFAVYLALEIAGHLMKALAAYLAPISEIAQRYVASRRP